MFQEKRKQTRIEWLSPGAIHVDGQSTPIPCVVSNLSNGGAKIGRVDTTKLPSEFTLDVWPSDGCTLRCVVIWRGASIVGVKFAEPVLTTATQSDNGRQVSKGAHSNHLLLIDGPSIR